MDKIQIHKWSRDKSIIGQETFPQMEKVDGKLNFNNFLIVSEYISERVSDRPKNCDQCRFT